MDFKTDQSYDKKCIYITLTLILSLAHDSTAQECGGHFTTQQGIITSPHYPRNYDNNLNCIYVITQPPGFRITLTFLKFQLEEHISCSLDFVEIHDGRSLTSPVINKRYCEAGKLPVQRTTQNAMLILFKTDNSTTLNGFMASYDSAILPQEFMLITGSPGRIYRVDIPTLSIIRVPVSGLYSPVGIHYDYVDDRIYWTDVQLKEIRSAFLNGSDNRLVQNLSSVAIPDGIAVDTQSRLIFYTDTGNDVIALITISTFERTLLITTDLDQPRAITLDTSNRVMFWTDWGTQPRIERANYEGSGRRILINSDLLLPNGIALDLTDNRLYWIDAGTDRVESSDTNGGHRKALFQSSLDTHFFGLAVYNSQVYITDWTSAGSLSVNSRVYRIESNFVNASAIIETSVRLNGINIYSEIIGPKGSNKCTHGNGGCSHICLPTNQSTKCMCPEGKSLAANQKPTLYIIHYSYPHSDGYCVFDLYLTIPESIITSSTIMTSVLPLGPVRIIGSGTFETDGSRGLTLTCDVADLKRTVEFTWNVHCIRKQNNTCTFKPQPSEDDLKIITCTVYDVHGQSATASYLLELNYPPPLAPIINGYTTGQMLQSDESLTMTCTVKGGKPVVQTVLFFCKEHPDTPDIKSETEVLSILAINPLTTRDNGSTCVCTALWQQESLYRLSDTTTLRVNGTGQSSKPSLDTLRLLGVAGGGVIVTLALVIVVVVIIKRRGARTYDQPQPRREERLEMSNPYNFTKPTVQLEHQCIERDSNVYTYINDFYVNEVGTHSNNDDSTIFEDRHPNIRMLPLPNVPIGTGVV